MSVQQQAAARTLTFEDISGWLKAQIAKVLHVKPQDINVWQTFAQYGLDSMQVATLSGDLEIWVGRDLSPSLVYDFPTVELLAAHLVAETAPTVEPTPSCLNA
jgi:acyl carrier protein